MPTDEPRFRAAEAELARHYGLEVREHRVAGVRVLEAGAGEPVVCVHGSPNAAAAWFPLVAAAPGFRWLLLERPGAGLSPRRTWGAHRRDAVAIVGGVLDALGAPRAHLVGSSFGALYAYAWALAHPERVGRLVLMGAPAGPSLLALPPILRALSLPGVPLLLRFGMKTDPVSVRAMWREIGHGPTVDRGGVPDVMFDWYAALLTHTATLAGLVDEARAIATPFGARRQVAIAAEELAAIRVPTLYLWGDDDTFASPADAERLAGATSCARLERFAGSGHLSWIDDPARIAGRLAAFC